LAEGGTHRLRHELPRFVGYPDVEPSESERLGDLRSGERCQPAAGDAAGEARHEPPVGDRVVRRARGRAGHRPRRKPLLEREVIEEILRSLGDRPDTLKPRTVGQ
jgi:hypothetical protein